MTETWVTLSVLALVLVAAFVGFRRERRRRERELKVGKARGCV